MTVGAPALTMAATPNSRVDDPALMATARGTPEPSAVEDSSLRDQIARAEIRKRMFGGHAPTIGRYTVLHPLGSGGMGTVFAAYDDRLDRRIAIKVLHHAGAEAGEQLLAEARALARVRHPNVVTVHDVGEDDDRVYIAMEYVEGGDLRRWLGTKPDWREALDVLVQAGRGLAAAHEAGVLHRDFKPENAILTPDGKVHVVDFGLALAPLPGSAREPQSGEHLPTHTGEFAGTPGYMPLEQLERGPVDERSDQFAFCVTLFEAVYGQRPFKGRDVDTLIAAVERGVESPPENPDAPRWLAGIILRGLASDPDARWPSMQALLETLERRRHPVRHRWLLGLAFLAGGGLVAASTMVDSERCSGASETIDADFSNDTRARVAKAFTSAAPAYGADTWRRIDTQLEDYAERWSASYTYFCEATHVRGELSVERLDERMQCLQRRWRQVSALMGAFENADAATVERASTAVESLQGPMTCQGETDDTQTVPPDKADAVQELELDLQDAIAVLSLGKYDEGAALAESVRDRAAALQWAPTAARASFQLAQGRARLGRLDDAIADYREAYFSAHALGMDALMAHAAGGLAFSLGGDRHEKAPALVWSELEAASLRRLDDAPTDDWHAHHNRRASIYHGAGELDDALEQMSTALEYNAEGTPLARATTLNNYAIFLYEAGRVEDALEAATEAFELHREHNGPDHPMTLGTQQIVVTALHGVRRTEQALEQATDLLARVERGSGPDKVGNVLNNRGNMYETLGRREEAIADFDRALELYRSIEEDSVDVAVALTGKALALKHDGRLDEALPLQRRSAEIFEAKLPKGHYRVGVALSNLGSTLTDSGDPAAAIPVLERAREQMLTNNRTGIGLVRLENNLALALAAVDRPADALAIMLEAEKRLIANESPNRYEVGKVRHNVGQFLHELGRNEEARTVLQSALEDLESSPPDHLRLAETCRNRAFVEAALGSDDAEVERWVERALHHFAKAPEKTSDGAELRAWWDARRD